MQSIKKRKNSIKTAVKGNGWIKQYNRKIALFQILKKWEEMLPEEYFFRIHRSTIINVEQIKRIEELNNKTYKVFLKSNEDPLNMSRRFGLLFKERFKA